MYEGTLHAESARAEDRWGFGQAGFHRNNSTNSRFRTQSFLVPAKKLISKRDPETVGLVSHKLLCLPSNGEMPSSRKGEIE